MLDHYYDKLLQIPAGFKPEIVQNNYLVSEAGIRVAPLLDICVEYGKSGQVPLETLQRLARECESS